MRATAIFQLFPPAAGAAAIRAGYFGQAIARQIGETGGQLTVLTSGANPRSEGNLTVRSIQRDEPDNSARLALRLWHELSFAAHAATRLLLSPRSDVVVLSSPSYLVALACAAAAVARNTPFVLDVRDLYPEVYEDAGLIARGHALSRLLKGASRWMYQKAAGVCTATEGLSAAVTRSSSRNDVLTIYNGFPEELRASADRYPRFTACFHGVLGHYQDIETLVAVARELEGHDVDVVVVGYGAKQKLCENGPKNLRFFGKRSFAETIDIISRGHVGLCLRIAGDISADSFAVKLFEYVGLELPSVVTPHCEGGLFVERAGAGVQLAAGDVAGIVGEILRLRTDHAHYQQQIDACRAIAPTLTRQSSAERFASWMKERVSHRPDGGSRRH